MSDINTLSEKMEEAGKLVHDIQSEHKATSEKYGKDIADTKDSVQAMESKVGDLVEEVQTLKSEKKAQDDYIKEISLAMARSGGADGEKGEAISEEVKSALHSAFTQPKGAPLTEIVLKGANEICEGLVRKHFPHITGEKQQMLVKSIFAEGSDPAGGIFCPVGMDSRIRQRVFETSPMRQLAEVQNIATSSMEYVLDDEEIEVAKSGEVNDRNQTETNEFGKVRIDAHELYAEPRATLQVLEDATLNLESYLSGKVSRKFSREQNKAFVIGNGEQEARGFLDYDETDVEVYKRGALGTKATEATGVIAGDDLIDIQSHLLEDWQDNATWGMHRLTWAKVIKLKDNEDRYLIDPLLLFNGPRPKLLGVDVRLFGDMPKPDAAGAFAANAKVIAYGDFRETYTIVDRLGINVIRDNITKKGFVKWYFRTRYGGGVTNFQSMKLLKIKA